MSYTTFRTKLNSFDFFKLQLASPNRILSWCQRKINLFMDDYIYGEIDDAEYIDLITHQFTSRGLFSQQIFGPIATGTCICHEKQAEFVHETLDFHDDLVENICKKCHVEKTDPLIRNYRLGFITLINPTFHPIYQIYQKQNLIDLLNFSFNGKNMFNTFFSTNEIAIDNVNISDNKLVNVFTSLEISLPLTRLISDIFFDILAICNINLQLLYSQTRQWYVFKNYQNVYLATNDIQTLRFIEALIESKINLTWFYLTYLPVLPAGLRPLHNLAEIIEQKKQELQKLIEELNEKFSAKKQSKHVEKSEEQNKSEDSDKSGEDKESVSKTMQVNINTTYQSIICLNQEILNMDIDLFFIKNVYVNQQQIDINIKLLFCGHQNEGSEHLKPFNIQFEDKTGLCRFYISGKRLNYSGRSVITVDPTLRLDYSAIPFIIASELCSIIILSQIINRFNHHFNDNFINLFEQYRHSSSIFYWILVNSILKRHCILLNRAPTLHRFNLQSFHPILGLDNTIHLHPLACNKFNADFDGDQMSIYLPLKKTSQIELYTLMRPSVTLFSSAKGKTYLKVTQDMILGCYYLTFKMPLKINQKLLLFKTTQSVIQAYFNKNLNLQTPILLNMPTKFFIIKLIKNTFFNSDIKQIFLQRNSTYKKTSIRILRIIKQSINTPRYCLFTKIGIFFCEISSNPILYKDEFFITKFFVQTTVGRILFKYNYCNVIKTYVTN